MTEWRCRDCGHTIYGVRGPACPMCKGYLVEVKGKNG